MCALPKLVEAYIQAMERNCLNPDIGKYLNEFNAIMNEEEDKDMPYLDIMVKHLIECRSCRQRLNFMAKHFLSDELFWRGHFLTGQAKIKRRQIRRKWRIAKGKEWIKLADKYLKQFIQEPWKSEHKKIKKFIED